MALLPSRAEAATLLLADGRYFKGRSFGASGVQTAEVVFNTTLTGYQEVLTDPSYEGQFVTFTMPIIGIVGVNAEDAEASRPYARGLIVRECSARSSNFRAQQELPEYCREHGIVGIEGLDTRALVLHLRERGAMNGVIATGDRRLEELQEIVSAAPSMEGLDLAKVVSCTKPYEFGHEFNDVGGRWQAPWRPNGQAELHGRRKVVVVDFGVKRSILRSLARRGCEVTVVPAMTPLEAILERNPDGILLSNGPGDPGAVTYGAELARKLAGKLPIMGICLGHQILGLAFGARTYKLKFGHRGGNHPVIEVDTGVVAITSQNHGFAVDLESDKGELVLTHRSLNDGTCEGLRHRELPIFSIQFHPEAGPGPHDGESLFDRFMAAVGVTAPTGTRS